MPLLSQVALLVVSINVLILGQSAPAAAQSGNSTAQPTQTSEPAQTVPKAVTTYVLDPVETSNATYPLAAREQKTQGEVVASMLISETGDVESTQVFKGDQLLAAAALEVMKKWKFKPVLKDGNPVAVVARVTFNFVLSDDNQNVKGVLPDIAPATAFPQRVRVSQGVSQGLILKKPNPVYPEEARATHIQGSVILQAVIGKDGTVTDVRLVSGHPSLAPAAIDAVRQWRYRPYSLMGRPVEVETQILINFALSGF